MTSLNDLNNSITRVDSYKASHYAQYPQDTDGMFDYIESRGGRWPTTIFFGLQMYLPKLLTPVTMENVHEARDDFTAHGLPFNFDGWKRIVEVHGGHLPIEIKALPEGGEYPGHTALVTVEHTDPKLPWPVSYVETDLLRAVWYPTTVATNSFYCKRVILEALLKSSDDPLGQLPFKLHDFGSRGVSSSESAILGGAAHLVNFMGTDTFECLRPIRKIYGEQMPGSSIVAAEHSTITSWRRGHLTNEVFAYRNMLSFLKKGGLVAVVSDSYDLWAAISNLWGDKLKEELIATGGTVVIRPDSGDPTIVPVKAVQMLGEKFGFTVNKKGYKVLPDCVRVIQGDGIKENTIRVILENLLAAGWSADNIAFGMGGALLQQVNRDTLKFAMKTSAVSADGVWYDVFKDPVTDPGKRSKSGRLATVRNDDGSIHTVPLLGNEERNLLGTVYRAGFGKVETFSPQNFVDIRKLANDAALRHFGLVA